MICSYPPTFLMHKGASSGDCKILLHTLAMENRKIMIWNSKHHPQIEDLLLPHRFDLMATGNYISLILVISTLESTVLNSESVLGRFNNRGKG